jgi:hypothetical protein
VGRALYDVPMTEGSGLTREHVVWAYRILLDHDPENEHVIGPKLDGSRDTRDRTERRRRRSSSRRPDAPAYFNCVLLAMANRCVSPRM